MPQKGNLNSNEYSGLQTIANKSVTANSLSSVCYIIVNLLLCSSGVRQAVSACDYASRSHSPGVSFLTFPTAAPTFQVVIWSAGKGRSRSIGKCDGSAGASQRS
jgi:hypothetical protein